MKTSTVTLALCQWLADNDFGIYRPNTPYQKNERAITVRRLPTAPEWALAVAPYGLDEDLVLPNRLINVQLRFRTGKGQPLTTVDDWADDVAEALHMRHRFNMGGLHVQRAVRTIIAPLGADENGREERADSYALLLMN